MLQFKKFIFKVTKETLTLILILLGAGFFLFWKIGKVPPLEGTESWYGYSIALFFKSFLTKTSFSELIRTSWQAAFLGVNPGMPVELVAPLMLPLWTLWLGLFYAISVNSFALHIESASLGIASILITYFIATRIFNKKIGFFSALLLSFSLFHLLSSRSGYGWQIFTLLFVSLTLYCFYQGMVRKQYRNLWLGGIFFGLGLFNGFPPIVIVPLILLAWLFWVYKGMIFLKNKHLWIAGIGALIIFFLSTIIYSLVFKLNSPFDTLKSIGALVSERGGKETIISKNWRFIFINPLTAFRNLFIAMPPYGIPHGSSMPNLTVVGKPMLHPLVSLFLIWGVILTFKRRSITDKFIISWLGVTIFIFTFLVTFEGRYILIAAPALYIIVACAMVHLVSLGRESDLKNNSQIARLSRIAKRSVGVRELSATIIILTVLAYNAFSTYRNYFVTYARNDAYLWTAVGNEEIADYIMKTSLPQECRVVFGHKILVPPAVFIFITKGKYPIQRWDDIVTSQQENIVNLQQWEENILSQGKKVIFYVFSLDNEDAPTPGKPKSYRANYEDMSLFKRLHPQLEPAKIVYYTCGLPAFAIYEVREPCRIKYDYNIGISGESQCSQTFILGHPILEKVKFQISYVGEKTSLPNLIIELRKTKEDPPVPDMTNTGLLTLTRVFPGKLNLKKGEYSTLSLPYSKLDPEATYAIIWKQERIDDENHYVLARQTSDIYEKGQSGHCDGFRWVMSDTDINFAPIQADYTIEPAISGGIHTFRIPKELTSSKMSFKIIFEPKKWKKEIFDQQNLICQEAEGGNFLWVRPKTSSGGYLVYKIESPYLIKKIESITNPRIHNDREKKNFLRFSYSVDGIKYYKIYELRSKGYGTMTGIFETPMDNTIQPKSKVVYLRFDFSEENAQLWATRKHPIIFNVEVASD